MLRLHSPSSSIFSATNTYSFRNILETADHFLLEVKKNELSNTNHFVWLKYSKDSFTLNSLNLNNKDSSYQIEELFFEEGYLKFNNRTGIFIEKFNSNQHHYQVRNLDFADQFTTRLNLFFNR